MKPSEFVELGISLHGYGLVDRMSLDTEFFDSQVESYGEIEDVLPIKKSVGGNILNILSGESPLNGCIIKFVSGAVMVIESDDEYIDWFASQ